MLRLKEKNIYKFIAIIIIVYLCFYTFVNGMVNSTIGFDGGWNATVAKNYADSGKYMTTYPSEELFNIAITTGQTVLLPTAIIFRLFGVSYETIAIIPLLYMCAFIVALYMLIKELLDNMEIMKTKGCCCLSAAIITTVIYFILNLYGILSYQLLGEGAAGLFLSLSLLCLNKYEHKKSNIYIYGIGFFASFAFISKTVTICFITVMYFVLMTKLVFKEYTGDIIGKSVLGAIAGFILCDLFKLIQFGFDFKQYIHWWFREFYYCFRLDQPEDFGGVPFVERYKAVADLLMDRREGYFFFAMMLLLPVIILFMYFLSMKKAGKGKLDAIPTTLLIMGLGGESYLVANILFGKGAFNNGRRLFIHGVFFLLFIILICIKISVDILKSSSIKNNVLWFSCFLFLAFSAFDDRVVLTVPQIWNYQYRGERDTVNEMVEMIKTLPENSEYYGVGWRFAPAVCLLADIEIKDVSENVSFEDIDTHHFYIVEDYPVEEIYEKYRYNVIYKGNENTWQGSIVELIAESER